MDAVKRGGMAANASVLRKAVYGGRRGVGGFENYRVSGGVFCRNAGGDIGSNACVRGVLISGISEGEKEGSGIVKKVPRRADFHSRFNWTPAAAFRMGRVGII